ncbi:MAG: hypothetical protein HQK77_01970 [Desulfobacterales bacterium]|nr:hypothetical protein [Desulfobacterales bacterium]
MNIKQFSFFVIFFISILPEISLANYLIKLHSGKQYITNNYWEENNQIKFNYLGGTMGVVKSSIKEITSTDKKTAKEIQSTSQDNEASSENQPTETKETTTETDNQPDAQSEKTLEDEKLKRFADIQERFGNIDRMTSEQVMKLAEDSVALRNDMINSKDHGKYTDNLRELIEMILKINQKITN